MSLAPKSKEEPACGGAGDRGVGGPAEDEALLADAAGDDGDRAGREVVVVEAGVVVVGPADQPDVEVLVAQQLLVGPLGRVVLDLLGPERRPRRDLRSRRRAAPRRSGRARAAGRCPRFARSCEVSFRSRGQQAMRVRASQRAAPSSGPSGGAAGRRRAGRSRRRAARRRPRRPSPRASAARRRRCRRRPAGRARAAPCRRGRRSARAAAARRRPASRTAPAGADARARPACRKANQAACIWAT